MLLSWLSRRREYRALVDAEATHLVEAEGGAVAVAHERLQGHGTILPAQGVVAVREPPLATPEGGRVCVGASPRLEP